MNKPQLGEVFNMADVFSSKYKGFILGLEDGDVVDVLMYRGSEPEHRLFNVKIQKDSERDQIRFVNGFSTYVLSLATFIISNQSDTSVNSVFIVSHNKILFMECEKRNELIHRISRQSIGLGRFSTDQLIEIEEATADRLID